jgi:hypothetical protein
VLALYHDPAASQRLWTASAVLAGDHGEQRGELTDDKASWGVVVVVLLGADALGRFGMG